MWKVLRSVVLTCSLTIMSCGGGSSPRDAGTQPERGELRWEEKVYYTIVSANKDAVDADEIYSFPIAYIISWDDNAGVRILGYRDKSHSKKPSQSYSVFPPVNKRLNYFLVYILSWK